MFGKNKEKKQRGIITGLIVGGAVMSVVSLLFARKKKNKGSDTIENSDEDISS